MNKFGAHACTLPGRLVRNQQSLGGEDKAFLKEPEHHKGLYARAKLNPDSSLALNQKKQTLRQSVTEHSHNGQNNRLQYKIESLKQTIDDFFEDKTQTDPEKVKLIQNSIWKPSMVIR